MIEWIEAIWHAVFRAVYLWLVYVMPAGVIAYTVVELFG